MPHRKRSAVIPEAVSVSATVPSAEVLTTMLLPCLDPADTTEEQYVAEATGVSARIPFTCALAQAGKP